VSDVKKVVDACGITYCHSESSFNLCKDTHKISDDLGRGQKITFRHENFIMKGPFAAIFGRKKRNLVNIDRFFATEKTIRFGF